MNELTKRQQIALVCLGFVLGGSFLPKLAWHVFYLTIISILVGVLVFARFKGMVC